MNKIVGLIIIGAMLFGLMMVFVNKDAEIEREKGVVVMKVMR